MGHQVDEAHQQEAPHTQHHEQEEEQDGGHRLHRMVAQMPLGEAHVHQLLVEVIEGGLSSTQPGTCLLLARTGTPQGGTMAPIEKALEGEDRKMNECRESFSGIEVRDSKGTFRAQLCLPLWSLRATPSLLSNLQMPPTGMPVTESQAQSTESASLSPRVLPGRRCPGWGKEEGIKEGWTTGHSF